MPLIESVMTAVKSADKLKSFVDAGDLGAVLAEIELQAAAAAIRDVQSAVDKRGQVWSAINHLETAFTAQYQSCRKTLSKGVMTPDMLDNVIGDKLRFYKCLMAVCYAYLGEATLCRQALELARRDGGVHGILNEVEGSWWSVLKLPVTLGSFAVSGIVSMARDPAQKGYNHKFQVSSDQLDSLDDDLMQSLGLPVQPRPPKRSPFGLWEKLREQHQS